MHFLTIFFEVLNTECASVGTGWGAARPLAQSRVIRRIFATNIVNRNAEDMRI
jgi:hypothetical protein